MTEQPGTGERRADDYEYDLCHEPDPAAVRPAAVRHPQLAPPAMHVPEDGGDYNYDAAHDRT